MKLRIVFTIRKTYKDVSTSGKQLQIFKTVGTC